MQALILVKSLLLATILGLSGTAFAHTHECDESLRGKTLLINHIVETSSDFAVKIGSRRFTFHKHPISKEIPTTLLPQEFPALIEALTLLNAKNSETLIPGEIALRELALKNFALGYRSFDKADLAETQKLLAAAARKMNAQNSKVFDQVFGILVHEGRNHFGREEAFDLLTALLSGLPSRSMIQPGFEERYLKPWHAESREMARNWSYVASGYIPKLRWRLAQVGIYKY